MLKPTLAKVECSEDDACVAVTDKFCNNEGLKLCKSLTTSRFDSDCSIKSAKGHTKGCQEAANGNFDRDAIRTAITDRLAGRPGAEMIVGTVEAADARVRSH